MILDVATCREEPGPGQYNPIIKPPNIRAITFGSGPQRPIDVSKYDIKPGALTVKPLRSRGASRHSCLVLLMAAPNKYLLPPALGAQLISTKQSAPSFSFGAR
jgi:hypothetical protein